MPRAGNDEKVTKELISQTKLKTIMKRFLESKANAEEICKWYQVKDGLHYMATNKGSSVDILFKNNFAGTYNPIGDTVYRKPDKDNTEVSEVHQYVEIKDGKKKKLMDTGHIIKFPNVHELFNRFDSKNFNQIVISNDEFDELISLHETISSMEKVSGDSFTSVMKIANGKMLFTVWDSPYKFQYSRTINNKEANVKYYFYDPNLFVNIIKSFKDLSVDKLTMFINERDPILFYSHSTEYDYRFAMHRKIIRKR